MITPQELASAYALDLATAKEQTEGLTHADSVLQPPVQGNCLNWVMGHVLDTRNDVLKLLGQPEILTAAQAKRYGYGSDPVCGDGPGLVKFDKMVALLEKSQASIEAGLARLTPEQEAKTVDSFLGPVTLAFYLVVLYHHESYHLGQAEILRQLALAQRKAP